MVWPVTRIVDTVGNEIWFSYTVTNGTYRISRIDYTCRGGVENNPAPNHVNFTYQARPDVVTNYLLGSKIVSDQRLASIDAFRGSQVVRHYDFTYRQAEISGRSQLVQLQEKGEQPSDAGAPWPSFSPTIFTRDKSTAPQTSLLTDTQAPSLTLNFSRSPPSLMIQRYFNGDGRMDIFNIDSYGGTGATVAFGQADGSFKFQTPPTGFTSAEGIDSSENSTYSRLRTGDFNADGKTDLLQMTRSGAGNWMAYGKADGSFDVHTGSDLGELNEVGQTGDFNTEIVMLDLNGDGRTEVIRLSSDGNNRVFLATGNSKHAFKEVLKPGADFSEIKISSNDVNNTWLLPGDYNGDGLGDLLVMYYTGEAWLALSNGDGTFTVKTGAQLGDLANKAFSRSYSYMISADYNGDGLTDVVNFDDHATAWMALSKGDADGNLLASTTFVSDGSNTYATTTVNQYQDQTGATWILGRLTHSVVAKTSPNAPTSAFAYDPTTGLLNQEVIEPANPRLCLTKTYVHDDYGNITDSTETAWNGVGTPAPNESRTKHTDYLGNGPDPRFIVSRRSALGQTGFTDHEPLLGQVTHEEWVPMGSRPSGRTMVLVAPLRRACTC